MILYHHRNNQIVFVISKDIVNTITDWLSHAEDIEDIYGRFHKYSRNILSVQGGFTLHFDLSFISNSSVLLRVNTVNSLGFATSAQASVLVSLANQGQHWTTTNNGEIIFSIPRDIYQRLENWKNWSALEALTPRYSYNFYEICSCVGDEHKYFEFFDRQTKELLIVTWDEYYESIDSKIENNINKLNKFIDRDYRIMENHESLRIFYPGYEQGIRIFHAESGLACKYRRFERMEMPI